MIIVESACEHNYKNLCRSNNQKMFTQYERSLCTFKHIKINNQFNATLSDFFKKVREIGPLTIVNLSSFEFDYAEKQLPSNDLNDLNQRGVKKMNIFNLKRKFRSELKNGTPTEFYLCVKKFGNNMPSVRLAVRLNDVEAGTPNAMKLCSDSTPKCVSKVQKKRIKTFLKIAFNFKWVTSESKVKYLLNSVNMPKIKYTNYTGK